MAEARDVPNYQVDDNFWGDFYDGSKQMNQQELEKFWTPHLPVFPPKESEEAEAKPSPDPSPAPVLENSLCGLRALVPLPDFIPEDLVGSFQTLWETFPDMDPVFMLQKLESRQLDPDGWALEFTNKGYRTIQERLRELEVEWWREEYLCDWAPERVAVALTEPLLDFIRDKEQAPTPLYKQHARAALGEHFSAISLWTIDRALAANNFHYFHTFHQIQDMINDKQILDYWDDDQLPVSCPELVDEVFFIEYQYTKNLTAVDKLLEKKWAEDGVQAREAGQERMCEICLADNLPSTNFVSCADGHSFCKRCLNHQARAAADNGMHRVECLWVGCGQEFSLGFLRGLVEVSTVERLCRLDQLDNLRLALLPDLVHCPFCIFAAQVPLEEEPVLQCLNLTCLKRSCRFCTRESHPGLSCVAVSHLDGAAGLRNFIQDKMSERVKRRCPSCSLACIKTVGCNHVTCLRCRTDFCYICSAIIPPAEKMAHFAPGKCPLVSSEMALHLIPAEEAASAAHEEYLVENPDMWGINLEDAGVHLLNKLDFQAQRAREQEEQLRNQVELEQVLNAIGERGQRPGAQFLLQGGDIARQLEVVAQPLDRFQDADDDSNEVQPLQEQSIQPTLEEMAHRPRRYPMGGFGRGRPLVLERPPSPRPANGKWEDLLDILQREINW